MHFYCYPGKGFPDVEDELNWHGKPLGPKYEASIAAVKALIKNQGPHGVKPLAFKDDAPKVDISKVHLSEQPNYKLGDKVRQYDYNLDSLHLLFLNVCTI